MAHTLNLLLPYIRPQTFWSRFSKALENKRARAKSPGPIERLKLTQANRRPQYQQHLVDGDFAVAVQVAG